MTVLMKTLHKDLERADALFVARHFPRARSAYQRLVETAQDKADRQVEIIARSMLARCLLAIRDLEGAEVQLDAVQSLSKDHHPPNTTRRMFAAKVRVHLERGPLDQALDGLQSYYQWATANTSSPAIIDACELIAQHTELEERVVWLERAIHCALAAIDASLPTTAGHGSARLQSDDRTNLSLGRLYTGLATALDQLNRLEPALTAWRQALHWQRQVGTERDVVATTWAVGAAAARGEDWPLAREQLEDAERLATAAGDCDDLLGLTLADLAQVYQAAGDVIEARRLLVRSIELGRTERINAVWPQRWAVIIEHARQLDLL